MTKFFTASLFLVAACSLSLAASDISGRWQITGDVDGNPVKSACTIKQDGAKLTGTCTTEGKDTPVAGELNDQKVTFHYDVEYQGDTYTLNYTGTLQSDTEMKGDIDVSGASGDFTAKKDPPENA